MEEKKETDQERLASQEAIDKLFDVCIEKGLEWICLQLVDFGISPKKIDLMIEIYLNAGDDMLKKSGILNICQSLAQKGASPRSVELIIAKCLKLGKLEHLPALLKVADRRLSVEEVESIYKNIPVWIEMKEELHEGMKNLNASLERLEKNLAGARKKD